MELDGPAATAEETSHNQKKYFPHSLALSWHLQTFPFCCFLPPWKIDERYENYGKMEAK